MQEEKKKKCQNNTRINPKVSQFIEEADDKITTLGKIYEKIVNFEGEFEEMKNELILH